MNDEPTDAPEEENDDASDGEFPREGAAAFTLVEPEDDETEETGEEDSVPEESAGTDDGGESEDGDAGEESSSADAPDEEEEDAEDGDADGEPDEGDEPDENGVTPLPITAIVEAVLFAAREPLKPAQIARAVGKRTRQEAVRAAIDELNVQYLETSRAFEIAEISGRFQLMSRPEYADYIMRIYPKRELTDKETKNQRLTPAMLDTLAIVAYKQPVMRSEIEHIRGVACGPALRTLIERGSVREVGRRADLVGKPAVFGTTERFLAEFGLGSLDELPMRNEFVTPGAAAEVEMALVQPAEEPDEAVPAGEESTPGEETAIAEAPEDSPRENDGDETGSGEAEREDASEAEPDMEAAGDDTPSPL